MSNSVSEPLKFCERKAVKSVRIILIHRVHSSREKDTVSERNEEIPNTIYKRREVGVDQDI